MMRLYWTGIGSRRTPLVFAKLMRSVARELEKLGFVLRSGGAARADTWWEEGVRSSDNTQIFLPHRGWRGHSSPLYEISGTALDHAARYHPNWHGLSAFERRLMARNSYQVLGLDLVTPSRFVGCWTPGGEIEGGTGQALRIAADPMWSIPVFNLFHADAVDRMLDHARGLV
jgi:hypothetical protein